MLKSECVVLQEGFGATTWLAARTRHLFWEKDAGKRLRNVSKPSTYPAQKITTTSTEIKGSPRTINLLKTSTRAREKKVAKTRDSIRRLERMKTGKRGPKGNCSISPRTSQDGGPQPKGLASCKSQNRTTRPTPNDPPYDQDNVPRPH